jgi:hypothetical protein
VHCERNTNTFWTQNSVCKPLAAIVLEVKDGTAMSREEWKKICYSSCGSFFSRADTSDTSLHSTKDLTKLPYYRNEIRITSTRRLHIHEETLRMTLYSKGFTHNYVTTKVDIIEPFVLHCFTQLARADITTCPMVTFRQNGWLLQVGVHSIGKRVL